MIYLLGGGKVSESGTHEELIKLNKGYADMYIKQARNYLADDEYEEVM